MGFIVETPATRPQEKEYIIGLIMGEFLGLEWKIKHTDREGYLIYVSSSESRTLTLPDRLLSFDDTQWLSQNTLPESPLPVLNVLELGLDAKTITPTLPVIFGDSSPLSKTGTSIHLPIDIFGSAFYMLSRYEEVVVPERDGHDRFPGELSLAFKAGFLERPIVDEYVEIMWSALEALWPGALRKSHSFRINATHDVDRPSRYKFGSVTRFLRAVAGDWKSRRSLGSIARSPVIRWKASNMLHPADPFNTFDWIMNVSEKTGLKNAFYFICGRTDQDIDAEYEPNHPSIISLMQQIHARGHEIGLHPSYNTYRDEKALVSEAHRLRQICSDNGIDQTRWGGRMHYLRWRHPQTLRLLETARMTYDSTLSYADKPGFRCGTSREYSAFDLIERKPLKVRIRPLIVMEQSVISPKYLGLGRGAEAFDKFKALKTACKIVGGEFTILWHNSELADQESKKLYEAVVSC